jgi:hypothetical protein
MSGSLSVIDVCGVNGLDVFAFLEGSETKHLQGCCPPLAAQLEETKLLRDLASCGFRVHEAAYFHQLIQSKMHLSRKQVYDAVCKEARLRGHSIATVLSTPDKYGRMPLYLAIKTAQHSAAELLLHLGADINAGICETGWSPLLLACWMKDVTAVELLIAHGADVDHCCKTSANFTPFAAAAAAQCLQACRLLVAAGASATNAVDLMSGSLIREPQRNDIIAAICSVMPTRPPRRSMRKMVSSLSVGAVKALATRLGLVLPSPDDTSQTKKKSRSRTSARKGWLSQHPRLLIYICA